MGRKKKEEGSSQPQAKWTKETIVALMRYRLQVHRSGFLEAKNKAKITHTWNLICQQINEDHKTNYTMLQCKSKMQILQKSYRDLMNAEKETGNKPCPPKPEYWEEMLCFFGDRDGLSGQSIINSNELQEFPHNISQETPDTMVDLEEEIGKKNSSENLDENQDLSTLSSREPTADTSAEHGEDFETLNSVRKKQKTNQTMQNTPVPSQTVSPTTLTVVAKAPRVKVDVGTSIASMGTCLQNGMQAVAAGLASRGSGGNQNIIETIEKQQKMIENNQKELIEVIKEQGQQQQATLLQLGSIIAQALKKE